MEEWETSWRRVQSCAATPINLIHGPPRFRISRINWSSARTIWEIDDIGVGLNMSVAR